MRLVLALATLTPLVVAPSPPPAETARVQANATVTITSGVQAGAVPAKDSAPVVTRTRPCDGHPQCRLIVRDMP